MIDTETLYWNAARDEAYPIRYAVFVDEQKVPPEMELDAHDPVSLHIIARQGGKAVGTGRLLPAQKNDEGRMVGHIGRMAVLKDWRGRGVGAVLLTGLMAAARSRGDHELVLSAQTHALGFYRRFGFAEEGPQYLDAGIPHQDMRRSFDAAPARGA